MSKGDWIFWGTMAINVALLAFNGVQLVRMGRYQREQRRRFDDLYAKLLSEIQRLRHL